MPFINIKKSFINIRKSFINIKKSFINIKKCSFCPLWPAIRKCIILNIARRGMQKLVTYGYVSTTAVWAYVYNTRKRQAGS